MFNRALADISFFHMTLKNRFNELTIGFTVRRVIVVKFDVKIGEILHLFTMHFLDERFRRHAHFFSLNHDGRAVCVTSANVVTFVS